MTSTYSEFRPVVPNIVDDTMKEDNETTFRNDSETAKDFSKEAENDKIPDVEESSTGRKIMIGLLIVVIIVLLLLLLYQLYIYFTSKNNTTKKVSKPPQYEQKQRFNDVNDNNIQTLDTDASFRSAAKGEVPSYVKDMDDNILSSFIQKNNNVDKTDNNVKYTERKTIDMNLDTNESTGNSNLDKIIDNKETGEESYVIDDDTREELLEVLREDNNEVKLHTIEEEDDNILNTFDDSEENEEVSSVTSEGGGCQFKLTKGKNIGQICGKRISENDRCSRHQNK